MNPYKILNDAIKAVPALRYALAVAGIGAVVSIVLGFVKDPQIAVFGMLITIGLMFILVIFSHAVKDIPGVRWLAAILAWAMTLLFIASLVSVFTAFAFSCPQTLASYFHKDEQRQSNAQAIRPEVNKYPLVQMMFQGNRENSGSVFEDLKTGKRTRFGNQDTKHNDACWVGRWSDSIDIIGDSV